HLSPVLRRGGLAVLDWTSRPDQEPDRGVILPTSTDFVTCAVLLQGPCRAGSRASGRPIGRAVAGLPGCPGGAEGAPATLGGGEASSTGDASCPRRTGVPALLAPAERRRFFTLRGRPGRPREGRRVSGRTDDRSTEPRPMPMRPWLLLTLLLLASCGGEGAPPEGSAGGAEAAGVPLAPTAGDQLPPAI